MKTVITGGSGFIGSYLCEELLKQGHVVMCIDNLLTGDINNIARLFSNEKFLFIKHDVTNYIYIDGKVDFVLHFASPASPVDYLKYPIQTLKVGSLGTHKALGLALAKKATFLLASTSEVYGDPLMHPQPETYFGNVDSISVRGVYDEAKRFAEALTMAYHRYHGLETRVARIFNTYGPKMRSDDGRVVPNFICQALKGEELTVYGDGTQTRSFCYIDDMVKGILGLLYSDYKKPLNIGNPQEMSVKDFAKLIIELTDSKSKIVHKPLPEGDPKVRQPDIALARETLGWQPEVPLKEGLLNTIEYFRSQLFKT